MRATTTILLGAAALLAAAQFIRPEKNTPVSPAPPDTAVSLPMPENVRHVLQRSCFDCHSNATRYPWYANIEPVGWWLAGHISHGKRALNFDEFRSYPARRRFAKLGQLEKQIVEGEMPLPSYLLIHRDALLTNEQKALLVGWTRVLRDSMKAAYPADSLARKPGR